MRKYTYNELKEEYAIKISQKEFNNLLGKSIDEILNIVENENTSLEVLDALAISEPWWINMNSNDILNTPDHNSFFALKTEEEIVKSFLSDEWKISRDEVERRYKNTNIYNDTAEDSYKICDKALNAVNLLIKNTDLTKEDIKDNYINIQIHAYNTIIHSDKLTLDKVLEIQKYIEEFQGDYFAKVYSNLLRILEGFDIWFRSQYSVEELLSRLDKDEYFSEAICQACLKKLKEQGIDFETYPELLDKYNPILKISMIEEKAKLATMISVVFGDDT